MSYPYDKTILEEIQNSKELQDKLYTAYSIYFDIIEKEYENLDNKLEVNMLALAKSIEFVLNDSNTSNNEPSYFMQDIFTVIRGDCFYCGETECNKYRKLFGRMYELVDYQGLIKILEQDIKDTKKLYKDNNKEDFQKELNKNLELLEKFINKYKKKEK